MTYGRMSGKKTYKIRNAEGVMEDCTDTQKKQMVCSSTPVRSPVIPFYWGYRPVDKAMWEDDQRQYREAMRKSGNSSETPYPMMLIVKMTRRS
jgi:hypothetical protein